MKDLSYFLVAALALAILAVIVGGNNGVSNALTTMFQNLASWVTAAVGPGSSGGSSSSTAQPSQPGQPSQPALGSGVPQTLDWSGLNALLNPPPATTSTSSSTTSSTTSSSK